MNKNIIEYLLTHMRGAHLVSGNREINCNCPICGDSDTVRRSTRKGGHFYISIPNSDDEPIFYNCKRAVCGAGGILTPRKLIEWQLPIDQDVSIELTTYNSRVLGMAKNFRYKDQEIYNIRNTYINDNELTRLKLKYINIRLGLDLTYKDIIDSKIVLNLNDILKSNNITNFTRHPNIVQELNDNFLGFLSSDNAFVNLKRIVDEGIVYKTIDLKYVKYNIFGKVDNTSYYTIPNNLDITKPINLRVAEGPFDILSVKYNLVKSDFNEIYTAIQGANYLGCIRSYLLKVATPFINIHIYVDSDIENSYIGYMINVLKQFEYPVYIHRNTIGKDMGVKLSKIKESVEKVL